jgi:hypothetical protein
MSQSDLSVSLVLYQAQAQELHHGEKVHDVRAFSKGSKPGGDLGGKDVAPIPGEAEIMTIFS